MRSKRIRTTKRRVNSQRVQDIRLYTHPHFDWLIPKHIGVKKNDPKASTVLVKIYQTKKEDDEFTKKTY